MERRTLLPIMSFLLLSSLIQAQTSRVNTIEERHFPTYNSDFSYYFVRRDMRLNELMYSTEVIAHEDQSVDVRTKGFIPILSNEKWNYAIPVYLDRYQFQSAGNSDQQSVYNMFGQSVLGYFPNDKWQFSHIIEFRLKGAGEDFMEPYGNFLAQFLNAKYVLNDQWALTVGSLIGVGWDHAAQNYVGVKPSFQLKWTPSPYLKVMAGMPASAIEWSSPAGIDFTLHTLLDGDELNIMAAARKNIGAHFDLTGRYLREGYTELYTSQDALNFSIPIRPEKIKQYQDKFQLELAYRPTSNTVIQIIGGYSLNRDMLVKSADGNQLRLPSNEGYYTGIKLEMIAPFYENRH